MRTTTSQANGKSAQSAANEALLYALLLKEKEAAFLLGVDPITLKISRIKETLLGHPAPEYLRFGRTIRYRRESLESWVAKHGQVVQPAPKKAGGQQK